MLLIDLFILLDDLGYRAYTFVLIFTVPQGVAAFGNSHQKVYKLQVGLSFSGTKQRKRLFFIIRTDVSTIFVTTYVSNN